MRKTLIIMGLIIGVAALLSAQDIMLSWGAVTNGGAEFPNGRIGPGMRLADNVGNGGTAGDSILSDGSSLNLYPGYRFVDLDLRAPISRIDSMDTVVHAPSFVVSWSGEDTTTEDGEGWGIRYYDVDYAVNDSTAWHSWFTHVTFTSAVFGPTSPVEVKPDSIYYFRVKAYDLATNEEAEHPNYDQKVVYKQIYLSFRVYNPGTDTAIWAPSDTFDPGETVTMDSASVLYVENTSTDSIILGVSAMPTAMDTSTWQPYWDLERFPNKDVFALRARFDDDFHPPAAFNLSDAVDDTFKMASDGYFGGPDHGCLAPHDAFHDSTQYREHLWLQVLLPTSVTQHGDTTVYQFIVKLKGQSATP